MDPVTHGDELSDSMSVELLWTVLRSIDLQRSVQLSDLSGQDSPGAVSVSLQPLPQHTQANRILCFWWVSTPPKED